MQTAEDPLTGALTDSLSEGDRLSLPISATAQETVYPVGGAVAKLTVNLALTTPDTVVTAAA